MHQNEILQFRFHCISGRSRFVSSFLIGIFILLPLFFHSITSLSIIPKSNDGILVVGGLDGKIIGLNVWTGKMEWSMDSGGPLVSSSVFSEHELETSHFPKSSTTSTTCPPSDPTCPIPKLRLAPSLDGRIFTISSNGKVQMLSSTIASISHESKPIQVPNGFIIGQKNTFVYPVKFQMETSNEKTSEFKPSSKEIQNYPTRLDSLSADKSMFYIGRSDYSAQIIHQENGSIISTMKVGEYFLQDSSQCTNPSYTQQSSDTQHLYPTFDVASISKNQEEHSRLVAYVPGSKSVLWSVDIETLVVSTYGLTKDGTIFSKLIRFPGPSSHTFLRASKSKSSSSNSIVSKIPQLTSTAIDPDHVSIRASGSQMYVLPPSSSSSLSEYSSHPPTKYERLPFGPDENSIPRRSHRTQEGLFMTWRLVGMVILGMCIMSFGIAMACYRWGMKNNYRSTDSEKETIDASKKTKSMKSSISSNPISKPFKIPMPSCLALTQRSNSLGVIELRQHSKNPSPISILSSSSSQSSTASASSPVNNHLIPKETSKKKEMKRRCHSVNVENQINGFYACPRSPSSITTSSNSTEQENELSSSSYNYEENPISPLLLPSSLYPQAEKEKQSEQMEGKAEIRLENLNASPVSKELCPEATTSAEFQSSPTPSPFVCFSRFLHEFEEIDKIGNGGFGHVVLARNRLDGRDYAIKKIGLSLSNADEKSLNKVLREVKILAILDHPHIVRYYQSWLEKVKEEEQEQYLKWMSSNLSYATTTTQVPPSCTIKEKEKKEEKEGIATSSHSTERLPWHQIEENRLIENQWSHDRFSEDSDWHLQDESNDGFVWERDENEEIQEPLVEDPLKKSIPMIPSSSKKPSSTTSQSYRKKITLDHWLYIQMQYCSNRTLGDFLTQPDRHVNLSHVLRLIYQIASALAHVHECGLLHRDLKPANIFVMDERCENLKLGDFGLSRYVNSGPLAPTEDLHVENPTFYAWDGNLNEEPTAGVGTYLYASPEQMQRDCGTYDNKTDVFSLGMIMFEMCYPSFQTGMERALIMQKARERIFPSTWDLPKRHPPIMDMMTQMLSSDAKERPSASRIVEWIEYLMGRTASPVNSIRSPRSLGLTPHMLPRLSSSNMNSSSIVLEMEEKEQEYEERNSLEEEAQKLWRLSLLSDEEKEENYMEKEDVNIALFDIPSVLERSNSSSSISSGFTSSSSSMAMVQLRVDVERLENERENKNTLEWIYKTIDEAWCSVQIVRHGKRFQTDSTISMEYFVEGPWEQSNLFLNEIETKIQQHLQVVDIHPIKSSPIW